MSTAARVADERGFSLVETLIAIVIAGIVVAAVIVGYTSAIVGANRHEDIVRADTLARAVAESIEGQVYTPCPATTYLKTSPDIPYPGGWSANDVTLQVRWWHAASDSFTASCPDEGLQRVTITVVAPSGEATRTLEVYKRSTL